MWSALEITCLVKIYCAMVDGSDSHELVCVHIQVAVFASIRPKRRWGSTRRFRLDWLIHVWFPGEVQGLDHRLGIVLVARKRTKREPRSWQEQELGRRWASSRVVMGGQQLLWVSPQALLYSFLADYFQFLQFASLQPLSWSAGCSGVLPVGA